MDNSRGSFYMVLAMAAFAIEDMFVKTAASIVSLGLIIALFGLGGTIIFCLLARRHGEAIFHPAVFSRPLLLRAICEVIARLTFALAITLTTLSSASAILQATPLITIIGAAFFFGERVGLKRWLAVFFGFVGVLLIIRPGLEGFELTSLFAVVATLGFAGRDLATRGAPAVLSNRQLGIYGFIVLIPTGIVMQLTTGESMALDVSSVLYISAAIVFGVIAYYALTIAMRTGDVSVVSPFRYSRLLFAMLFGVLIFNERPDGLMLLGALLIVLSGGYTLISNKKAV